MLIKLDNLNNLQKGDKLVRKQSFYIGQPFNGEYKELETHLEIICINRISITVKDITYDMEYNLLKEYEWNRNNHNSKYIDLIYKEVK